MTHEHTERIEAGPLALTLNWDAGVISSLNLGPARSEESVNLTELAQKFKTALQHYVSAQPVTWPEIPMDTSKLTDFSRRVLTALKEHAAHGTSLTYGELAQLAGSPGSARAVGRVMANNRWPLVYP